MGRAEMIHCLALSPSLDVTYLVGTLRRGSISRPREVYKVAGGKALNVARVAARLGADVRAIAVLGGHTGDHIAALLEGSGVALDLVPVAAETRTCISIAVDDDDRLTEVYEPSPPLPAEALAAVRRLLSPVGPDDWIVLSGSLPPGCPPGEVADVLLAARSAGARVAVDTHGSSLEAVLAIAPDVVKVNREEAAAAAGIPVATPVADIAARLRARTGGIVVVTDGVAGSLAVDANRSIRMRPDRVVGRFPVGSGDSFTAGLVVALARGDELAVAMALGAAAAGANASVPGAASWPIEALDPVLRRMRDQVE